MADRVLREPCVHGRYEGCGLWEDSHLDSKPCSGGREVTIDWEAMLAVYDPEFTSWRAGNFDDDWERLQVELEAAALGEV